MNNMRDRFSTTAGYNHPSWQDSPNHSVENIKMFYIICLAFNGGVYRVIAYLEQLSYYGYILTYFSIDTHICYPSKPHTCKHMYVYI